VLYPYCTPGKLERLLCVISLRASEVFPDGDKSEFDILLGESAFTNAVYVSYSHCWKGTILRRAEFVQNSIHHHKILP